MTQALCEALEREQFECHFAGAFGPETDDSRLDALRGWLARAALSAPPAEPVDEVELLKGWKLNHIQFGRGSGTAEIGYLDAEADRFSPIVTVDTGLYDQPQDAVPLARAILNMLATPAQPPAAYPVKKVLEFAEYMAKGAEQFLAALNKLYAAEDHLEDGEHDEESRQAVDTAREAISDMWRSLECDIYEFRKRAAKVRLPAVEAEPDSAVPALMREPQLVRCGIYRMPNSQWVRYLGLSRRRGELGQALFLPVRDADRRSFCLPIETAEQLRLVYTPEQWALKSLVAQGV